MPDNAGEWQDGRRVAGWPESGRMAGEWQDSSQSDESRNVPG